MPELAGEEESRKTAQKEMDLCPSFILIGIGLENDRRVVACNLGKVEAMQLISELLHYLHASMEN